MDFKHLVTRVVYETTVIGGSNSAMGSAVSATANANSKDSYATKDNRTPKLLFSTIFKRSLKNSKRRKKNGK